MTGPIVQRLFALAASGSSIRSIAATFSREGILTPTGKTTWSHTTVRQLLVDPTYTGEAAAWRFAKVQGKRAGSTVVRLRDAADQVKLPDGTVPELVTAAVFNAVQERLRLNKLRVTRNNRAPHLTLLRGGYVHCGICGYTMHAGYSTGGRRGYGAVVYECGHAPMADAARCRFTMRAALLDSAVWKHVETLLKQPEVIALELERMRAEDPSAQDLSTVERDISNVARQQLNLVEQLANVSGSVTDLVTQKLNTLEALRRQLEIEQQVVLSRQEAWAAALGRIGELDAWVANVAANLDALTYDEKRLALDALNVQVKLWPTDHDPRYEVSAFVPLPGGVTPGGNCDMNSSRLFHGSTR